MNLQNYDMGKFFFMISSYDDYIIDIPGVKENLKIPEYQPGDTLRIMAPLYVACFSDDELINLAKQNLGFLPGSKELMNYLHKKWDIFVISTSYTHFAYTVTGALGIPKEKVYCTDLMVKNLKESLTGIEDSINVLVKEIFQKYLNNNENLESVIEDLNNFFWKAKESDYIKVMNHVKVRGGKRKEFAVEDISNRTNVPISDMIALGDSITDINMLQRLKNEGGIAISFNGNRFSLERANIAITTPNNLGVLPVFESKNNIEHFLKDWETEYDNFKNNPKNISNKLISKHCKNYFVQYNFVPEIINLTKKSKKQLMEIIYRQETMRKKVRGWAGALG
ncbi:MAG: HAD hydrolase family protein [Promethearchaeota archaeon]